MRDVPVRIGNAISVPKGWAGPKECHFRQFVAVFAVAEEYDAGWNGACDDRISPVVSDPLHLAVQKR
jgi:hypothetical protein